MGSWGRGEVVAGSDAEDWVVLIDGPSREDVAPSAAALDQFLDRGPTDDGPFGRVAARHDLVDRVGLDDERNRDLTLRLLLLLESAPLVGDDAWRSVRGALLDGIGHGQRTIARRDSCSTTSSATGARSPSTSRANGGAGVRAGDCAT